MLILVTGARGFIGRCVCSVLTEHGRSVVGLDRKGMEPRVGGPSPCRLVECDIRDRDRIEQLFQDYSFGAVVHLAALLRTASESNPLAAAEVNILGSLNLLEAARRFGVTKFIYASSLCVYGSMSCPSGRATTEGHLAAPDDVYGTTKRYVEIAGAVYRRQFAVQFTALRICNVLGPGAHSRTSPWRSEVFERMGLSYGAEVAIPYRGDEALPLVHVEDVADMVECLVGAKETSFSVYNALSETWKLSRLAEFIRSLDDNLRITFGEATAGGSPRAIDSRRFAGEFGYAPVSLKERLRRAARCRLAQAS